MLNTKIYLKKNIIVCTFPRIVSKWPPAGKNTLCNVICIVSCIFLCCVFFLHLSFCNLSLLHLVCVESLASLYTFTKNLLAHIYILSGFLRFVFLYNLFVTWVYWLSWPKLLWSYIDTTVVTTSNWCWAECFEKKMA